MTLETTKKLEQMRISLVLLLIISYITISFAQIPPPLKEISKAELKERQGIVQCFKNYQEALLEKDGKAASKTLSKRTFEYYEQLLDQALYAGKTQLLELNMIDVIAVLASRLKIEKEQLRKMNAQDYIETAIELGMIGDSSQVTALDIASPITKEDSARAALFINKSYTGFYMQFHKEKGKWKLDIVPMMYLALGTLERLQKESGLNKEEYIFMLLGYANQGKVDVRIWNPLFKKKKSKNKKKTNGTD